MNRRRIHLLFGVVALAFGAAATWDGAQLVRALQVNAAIAAADSAPLQGSLPEVRFAQALGLAQANDVEGAAKAYKALIQEERGDLRRAALLNLGNLRLREALQSGAGSSTLPLVELAKQSYRDLLREDPWDWDARYNLEHALWLAPELDPPADEEDNVPTWERRVAPRAQGFSVELP